MKDSARPLAFVCAMPRELRPLARQLALRPARHDDITVYRGSWDGHPVAGVVTGMGTELAAAATRRFLDSITVDRVVVVGISGAVDDVVPIGTVVAPEVVVDGASGARFRPEPLPGVGERGILWTSDVLVTDPVRVAELRERGVVALDMETAAIAAACEARHVRWSVLRAISDRVTDGSVDATIFGLNHMDGSPDPAAVVRYVLARPTRVARLAKLARDSRIAVRAAADAAIGACRAGWLT